jgi:hypothetical protein
MGKLRYTAQQGADALKACKGMITIAAKQLNCDVDTVLNYCKRYPICEAAKRGARDEVLDEAELRLVAAIRRDEPWAISFCLKTIGRSRGYGERLDIGVTIQAAAARVAAEFGLSPHDVIEEARLLLQEVESDVH